MQERKLTRWMKEFLSKRGFNPDNWRYLKYIPNKELIIIHKHALNPKVINLEGIGIEKPAKQPEHCPNCGYKTVSDGKYVCCFACGYNV